MKRTYIIASVVVSIVVFAIIAYVFVFHIQNRYIRDVWQQPEKMMDLIGIKEGMIIGEAGAGQGYLTFKLAERVGRKGHIYANDIDEKALNVIQERLKREGITNITVIKGEIEDPLFPERKLDMVVMLLTLHHITKKEEWLNNVKSYMQPQTPLVIIERDPQRYWGRDRGHFLKKEQVLEILEKGNFELVRLETSLPRDNIYVCRIKD
jgi:ubiquinone/menaquinone biosynthesis C-methylase UbiE